MAITNVQQGVITEAEFAKICILTSNGRLIPTRALADDDRRDFEIHIRRHFGESLAVQLKTAKRLRLHGRSRVLQVNFREKAPLISDPRLLYFLAHFDIKIRGFTDPVFLVPSPFFHKHALHGVGRGAMQLQFKASMEPDAKDMWAQWALEQSELGQRVLHMLNAQPGHSRLDPKVEQLIAMSGTVWLHRPSSIVVPKRNRAA
ncbi:MAG TPA: hypothetical protein VHK65_06200 [Candidatus Dormibacteraeota bacterium]|nr:hypothetical protein [Candidatus Dormibacteraeota bacterium]